MLSGRARVLAALMPAIALVVAGCNSSGVSESDQAKVSKEFSRESYEKAMVDAGKGKELEEEKRKEAEHLNGGAPPSPEVD